MRTSRFQRTDAVRVLAVGASDVPVQHVRATQFANRARAESGFFALRRTHV
jgi:hypothetical protein